MQFKSIALAVFAAGALAVAHDEQPAAPATTPAPVGQGDLLKVLLTALPSQLLKEAITNQGAVSSVIASEFQAGVTEDWFKSLPTPVQQYLIGQGKGSAPVTATPTGAPFYNTSTPGGTAASTPFVTANRTTRRPGTSTFAVSETGAATSLENRPVSTPTTNATSSAGGAMHLPLPTAAIGAGVVGAIGIIGMMGL